MGAILSSNRYRIYYIRQSSTGQLDNFSREDQLERARKLKDEFPDTLILDENEEGRGRSASKERIWERPKMREALEHIARDEVLEIHGVGLDRLSRDEFFEDGAHLIRLCYEHQTKIVEPGHSYDFNDDTDRLAAFLKFFVAGSKKGSDTTHQLRGLRRAAADDELCPSCPPVGYRHEVIDHPRNPMRKRKILVREASEGDLVHAIFDNYEDMSETALAKWLFQQGYRKFVPHEGKRKNGNPYRPFLAGDIRKIITNPIYMGFWGWGKHIRSRLNVDFERKVHYHPEWQWVSQEQWQRCNALAQSRKGRPWSASSRYAFSGLLRCIHDSEHHMQGYSRANGRPGFRYSCSHKMKPPYDCPGHYVEESIAGDALQPFVIDFVENTLHIKDLLDEAAAQFEDDPGGIKGLRLEVFRIEEAMNRLKEAVQERVFSWEELREQKEKLQDKRARIEVQLEKATRQKAIRSDLADVVALVKADIPSVIARMDNKTFGKLCKMILEWVQVEGRGLGKAGKGRRGVVVGYKLRPELEEYQLLVHTPGGAHPCPR